MSAAAKTAETAEIAATIVAIRHAPSRREELVALLAEQSPIYRGLSAGAAERLRGFILASFEKTGLPPSALPFVREELQTGINPYTVAAAAKALRGTSEISDDIFALLVAAAERIAGNDDNVQYETIDPVDRVTRRTGALTEIIRTIAASGPRARPLWAAIDAMAARGNVCCGRHDGNRLERGRRCPASRTHLVAARRSRRRWSCRRNRRRRGMSPISHWKTKAARLSSIGISCTAGRRS